MAIEYTTESTILWKMIWDCLSGDAPLIALLGHTSSNSHIGRIQQKEHLNDPCLTFGQQTLAKIPNNDQPRILSLRRLYFQLNAYSEKSDAIAANVMEIALEAIVGERLNYNIYKTEPIDWDQFLTAPYWDEDEKNYRVDSRISIIIKQCSQS